MSDEKTKYTPVSCHGRQIIYSSYDKVTDDNIFDILAQAIPTFLANQQQINYLDNYRKGLTPVLLRTKKYRPEINNKINVNRASEIVSFKVGYFLNEPEQLVARGTDSEEVVDQIARLNEYMYLANKDYHDRDIVEKFSVAGTAYRLILPTSRDAECPFEIFDVDTSQAFVVYSSKIGNKPLMGCIAVPKYVFNNNISSVVITYCCYTKDRYYEISGSSLETFEKKVSMPHFLKTIPLIEYPNNASRTGDFELVLPLLDALSTVTSNRIDGVEQFIQSFLKFINVDISEDDFEKLKEKGVIKVTSVGDGKSDVEFVTQKLDQSDTQTLINSINQDIMTITGMPNQIGSNASTSDNVGSVIVRNGWEGAESRARSTELIFKRSEKEMLNIAIACINTLKDDNIKLQNVGIKLPRRNYENIGQKATVLTQMLGSDKIAPKLAFESCGLFNDPEVAYIMSKNYVETLAKIQNKLKEPVQDENKVE